MARVHILCISGFAPKRPGLLGGEAIEWNSTKFLVGRDGRVLKFVMHRSAAAKPEKLKADIEAALAQN
jgi:glutathione peroxidase